jgi:hypothetical protein
MNSHEISVEQVHAARKAFEENEPRDLFYRAAIELVTLALEQKTSLSVTEAIAVLLQTWNKAFYRFHPFTKQHVCDIERVVSTHHAELAVFRQRSIGSFCDEDVTPIESIFNHFEAVLGPVGAAKSLHLLAPDFFPLWDRAITKAYRIQLQKTGQNARAFTRMMVISKRQVELLGGKAVLGRNPLKAIDEYNYCKFTLKVI